MDADKIIINLSEEEKKLILGNNSLADIQGFMRCMQQYRAGIKEIRTKLEILDEEFKTLYDYNPIHHIESRLKSPKSIMGKLKKKGLPFNEFAIRKNITDIAGVRVICNYIDDVNNISKLLCRQTDVKLLKKSNYITNPKESGYRSLHLVVEVPVFLAEKTVPTPVEVQIRTIAMDFWASLEHKLKYKTDADVSDELRERLRICAEEIAELDLEMQQIHEEIKQKN